MRAEKKEEFEQIIKNGIREHAPLIANFFDYTKTLPEHARPLYGFVCDPAHVARQACIAACVHEYVKRVHGIAVDVPIPMAVNIMDHHAMINNPLSIATNVVANADRLLLGDSRPIVTFSTSIPPQDNYFSDVRFHGKRLQFFSKNEIPQSTCFMPLHEFRCSDRLRHAGKWNEFSKEEQEFIQNFEHAIGTLDYGRAQNMNDQVSILNRYIWKRIFDESLRGAVPDMIHIPNEDIVRSLAHLIIGEENMVNRALFDSVFRASVLERFEGLFGCWDAKKNKGTHFFWHRKENRPQALFVKGDALVSDDGLFLIPLERNALIQALQSSEIIPNLFVIYSWLSLYSGIRPLVGYGSLNYITDMKRAWLNVLQGVDDEEHARVQTVNTLGMIGGLIVAFKRSGGGSLVNQYALDLLYDGGMKREYLERLFEMKFNDLLNPALLDIYGSFIPAHIRKKHSLTTADLLGEAFDWIQ